MSKIERFEDLIAWQKARELTKEIYSITRQGAFVKDYGLSSQTEKIINNSTQFSALSPYYFEKICTELLSEGKSVRFEAPGKSMYPVILDGETLIVEPIAPSAVKVGDIILYKSQEKLIAHRVISIKKFNTRKTQPSACNTIQENTQSSALSLPRRSHAFSVTKTGPQSSMTDSSARITQYSLILRGDASFSYDEPVYADQILGKVIAIEGDGRRINPYSLKHKLSCWARIWRSRIKRSFF
jgi:signal peptidase I